MGTGTCIIIIIIIVIIIKNIIITIIILALIKYNYKQFPLNCMAFYYFVPNTNIHVCIVFVECTLFKFYFFYI